MARSRVDSTTACSCEWLLQHLHDVRFTPNSGHVRCTRPCLLCANSGHLLDLGRDGLIESRARKASRVVWTLVFLRDYDVA